MIIMNVRDDEYEITNSAQSAFYVRIMDRWLQHQFGGDTSDTVAAGEKVCRLSLNLRKVHLTN